jgi:glyoxylase-like metal-dependent hydrolase (beta-lactamase superfamily II)
MEVTTNVHVIPSRIVNAYLIVDPDGLTLIDTGLARNGKRILSYITGLGYSPRDLERIVITHADGDHVAGLAALKAASGAYVYASPVEAEAIAAGRMSRELKLRGIYKGLFALAAPLFKVKPVAVDERVADGQVLPALGGLRVVATPGHTPGHISLYAPAAGVLFVGDSMVSERDGLRPSRGANTWDKSQALESVRLQAALGARVVCPAHGPVVHNAIGKFPEV